ncbi:hypothetical protein CVT26_013431 [Gymnopilus dilepis]|uniref:Uncharacterized protein n=1 Tax=Gymnopilus dilepis TaxID=231916 RepID=A0A409YWU8_9AGAR|nr:hypothetical protein CVT26_013431 [Gymnopilus dilepis]
MSSTPVPSSPDPAHESQTQYAKLSQSDASQQVPPEQEIQSQQPPRSNSCDRPLSDVISEKFAPFDAQSRIAQPFADAEAKDVAFQEELSRMLLKAIVETHAWAASRPQNESSVEGQKLEERIAHIMDTEREQGMCSPTPTSQSSSSSFYRFRIVGMPYLSPSSCFRTAFPTSHRPYSLGSFLCSLAYTLFAFLCQNKPAKG